MLEKTGWDKWVIILNNVLGEVLTKKTTLGQRPKGDERMSFVDTWETFIPIVINLLYCLLFQRRRWH